MILNKIFSDGIYILTSNFFYKIEYKKNKIKINIPKGFSWNGVTNFRTTSKTLVPSLVHDWLIFDRRINGNKKFTRKEMDKIFIIVCKKYGVSFWEIILFRVALNIQRNILR